MNNSGEWTNCFDCSRCHSIWCCYHVCCSSLFSFLFLKRPFQEYEIGFLNIWVCQKIKIIIYIFFLNDRAQILWAFSTKDKLFWLQKDPGNGAWNSNTVLKYCGESPTFAGFSSSLFYMKASYTVIPSFFTGKALFL